MQPLLENLQAAEKLATAVFHTLKAKGFLKLGHRRLIPAYWSHSVSGRPSPRTKTGARQPIIRQAGDDALIDTYHQAAEDHKAAQTEGSDNLSKAHAQTLAAE